MIRFIYFTVLIGTNCLIVYNFWDHQLLSVGLQVLLLLNVSLAIEAYKEAKSD